MNITETVQATIPLIRLYSKYQCDGCSEFILKKSPVMGHCMVTNSPTTLNYGCFNTHSRVPGYYQPKSLRKYACTPNKQETRYVIGTIKDGVLTMTHGPNPNVFVLLDATPRQGKFYILLMEGLNKYSKVASWNFKKRLWKIHPKYKEQIQREA